MKIKLCFTVSILIASLFLPIHIQVIPTRTFQLVAEGRQNKKNRIQVVGYGKTKGQALISAQKNAKKFSYKYREIRRSYSGSQNNWTCILIIEY